MKKICILLCFLLMFLLSACNSAGEKELILPEATNDELFIVLDDAEKPESADSAADSESSVAEPQPADAEKEKPQSRPPEKEPQKPEPPAAPEPAAQEAKPEEAVPPTPEKEPETADTAAEEEKAELTATLEIRCDNALSSSALSEEKRAHLPQDGIILAKCEVSFEEGESVFDVLLRETRARKIHFEFSKTPAYNSAYVEGIANLYEFDCGELSGWNYAINGAIPRTGCNQYKLQPGDNISWFYMCDYTSTVEE
ncbi:MAG: DUF4430 domain-containing protein [Oscillospiraceae bacterium]|nr:DUF4430 domain-containing protein [Oscillospiraceae bacterium]